MDVSVASGDDLGNRGIIEDDEQGIEDDAIEVLDSVFRRERRTGLTSRCDGKASTRFCFRYPFSDEEKILFTFLSAFVALVVIKLSGFERLVGKSGNTSKRFNLVSVSNKKEAVLHISYHRFEFVMMQNRELQLNSV